MTLHDVLKLVFELVFGLLGSKTVAGGVRNSEVYEPPADTLISTQGRFNFFRDTYRMLLNASLILALTMIGLIGANCWIVFSAKPQDRFFVAAVDGRVIPVLPMDLPNAPNNEVFTRTGTALTDSLTFGYLDQDFRRAELAQIFAPGIIEKVQQTVALNTDTIQQLSAQLKSFMTTFDNHRPGGIIAQGINPQSHIYEWIVQLPITVTTKMGLDNIPTTVQPFTLQVVVRRSRAVESRYGYLISGLIAAHADGPVSSIPAAASAATPPPSVPGTVMPGGPTP